MHLQSEGIEHSGSGNRGASSLKKRLLRSPSVAGHAPDCPTTLTACHGCLKDSGSFDLVTICGSFYVIRYYDHDARFRKSMTICNWPRPHSAQSSTGPSLTQSGGPGDIVRILDVGPAHTTSYFTLNVVHIPSDLFSFFAALLPVDAAAVTAPATATKGDWHRGFGERSVAIG